MLICGLVTFTQVTELGGHLLGLGGSLGLGIRLGDLVCLKGGGGLVEGQTHLATDLAEANPSGVSVAVAQLGGDGVPIGIGLGLYVLHHSKEEKSVVAGGSLRGDFTGGAGDITKVA